MKRLCGLFLLLIVFALAFVVACGGDDDEEEAPAAAAPTATTAPAAVPTTAPAPTTAPPAVDTRMGGTLKIVPQGSLKSLDPQWTTLIVTAHVKRHMQEALFHPDANFSLQPFLVKDFSTSADGLTWTFGLREGLKFHDGTAVTAADVVGSFNRVAEKAIVWKLVRSDFGAVMSAVDDQTIQVLLEKPTGLVIDGLNIEQSFSPVIVPQAIYSLPQSETAETSIGTGPFKFVEWLPGDRWIAERWDDYKPAPGPSSSLAGGHTVYFDRIEWIEVPDMASRLAALETGQMDILDEFKADFAQQVRDNSDLNLFINKPGNGAGLWLNHVREPFNNKEMRRAVQIAYPVDKAMTGAVGDPDFWRRCPIVIGCGTKWDTPAARVTAEQYLYQERLDEARQIVEREGYKGYKMRVMQPLDMPVLPDEAAITAELFEDLGFDVELQSMDWATLGTRRADPDLWEAFHTWSGASRVLSPLIASWIQKEGWFNNYQDITGTMTELYSEYANALTEEGQIEASAKISNFVHEDIATVQYAEFFPPLASRTYVKNWNPIPFPLLWDAWFEK